MTAVGALTQLAHPIRASFLAASPDLQQKMDTHPAPTGSPPTPLSRPGSAGSGAGGARRPKLTLSIATVESTPKLPPSRQAKSATLRLGPASDSPTSLNTYKNAQQIMLSPLSPRGSAPADISSPRTRAFMSPLSPLPQSAGPRHRSSKQRLPFPLESVNAQPLPYSQPSGVKSILRNSPHRSHGRRSSKASPETASSLEPLSGLVARFSASSEMSNRAVKYREDNLEEEIRTTRHTFSHLDLLDQLETEEEDAWIPPTAGSENSPQKVDKEVAEAEAAELKRLNDLARREFEQEKARLNKSTAGKKPIIFTPPPRRKAANTPVASRYDEPESAAPKTPGLPPKDLLSKLESGSENSSSDSE